MSDVVRSVGRNWRPLLAVDVCYKAIALIVIMPLLVSGLNLCLALSGNEVLADVDIIHFATRPLGFVILFVAATVLIAVVVSEHASLLAILAMDKRGESRSFVRGLWIVARNALPISRLAGNVLFTAALWLLPMAAVVGVAYGWLLTEHDINYYLRQRPPQFTLALVVAGLAAIGAVIVILRLTTAWAVALPLQMLERMSPRDALRTSQRRLVGQRLRIAFLFVLWWIVTTSVSVLLTAGVHFLARWILPNLADSSLGLLVLAIALTLGAVILVQVFCTWFSAAALAAVVFEVYWKFGGESTRVEKSGLSAVPARPFFQGWRWGLALATGFAAALMASYLMIGRIRFEDKVEITAHRGASGSAPENTLAAVRAAIEQEADWVEIDVQESADGEVIVFHDSDFMRQAGNPLKIWDATSDQLRDIDIGSWHSPQFSQERVPTLREVLEICKDKIRVNIELKYYGHNVDLERKVVEIVESLSMEGQIVMMSLERQIVERMKTLRPDWTCGLLTAVKIGELWKAPGDFLAVKATIATRRFVRSAQLNGKRVHVWTVNDPVSISTMISRGIDNIITDYPQVAQSVLHQRAALSVPERTLLEIAHWFGIRPRILDQ
jgi:glycerophosphoryl diester phosphodiesterase